MRRRWRLQRRAARAHSPACPGSQSNAYTYTYTHTYAYAYADSYPSAHAAPDRRQHHVGGPASQRKLRHDAVTGSVSYPLDGSNGTSSAATATVSVVYDAASRSYTIANGGRVQSFAPGDLSADSDASVAIYEKRSGNTTDSLTLTRPGTGSGFDYDYVGSGFFQRTVEEANRVTATIDAFTYGVVTPNSAIVRTGSGFYLVDVLSIIADPGQPYAAGGTGRIDVDFASGRLNISAQGDGFGIIDDRLTRNWQLTGSAQLAADANRFSGTMTMIAVGNFTGSWNGRFYGPGAEEIGASFALSGPMPGMSAIGTITGRNGASGGGETLTTLTSARAFATTPTNLSYQKLTGFLVPIGNVMTGTSGNVTFTQDPNARTYRFGGTPSDPTPSEFGDADLVAAESNARFVVYRRAGSDRSSTLTLYRPGSGNDQLVLNYASFGTLEIARSTPDPNRTQMDRHHFDYGLRTDAANMPRIGTGNYNAILTGSLADATSIFRLSGDANFAFDFANNVFTGTLRPVGTNIETGTTLTLTPWSVNNGTVFTSTASFSSALLVGGQPGQPFNLHGRFYGPGGQEIGATFLGSVANPAAPGSFMPVSGAVVGKRN